MATIEQSPVQLGMSLEDYIQRCEDEGRFELWRGERIAMTPTVLGSIYFTNQLADLLKNYAKAHQLGVVLIETTFILPSVDQPNWVSNARVPDILFVSQERFSDYLRTHPEWRTRPLSLVPELVVEVLSPTDRATAVNRKVALYLEDGVQRVWVVDPTNETVVVYAPDTRQFTQLAAADMLMGAPVLPGFQIRVGDIFAAE